jgi:hypothetical protein
VKGVVTMELNDYVRGSQISIGTLDLDGEIEVCASSDQNDIVWFYINKENAEYLVKHLTEQFDLDEKR